VTHKKI